MSSEVHFHMTQPDKPSYVLCDPKIVIGAVHGATGEPSAVHCKACIAKLDELGIDRKGPSAAGGDPTHPKSAYNTALEKENAELKEKLAKLESKPTEE